MTVPLSCETKKETFSEYITRFNDKVTASPELFQTRACQTTTDPDYN